MNECVKVFLFCTALVSEAAFTQTDCSAEKGSCTHVARESTTIQADTDTPGNQDGMGQPDLSGNSGESVGAYDACDSCRGKSVPDKVGVLAK